MTGDGSRVLTFNEENRLEEIETSAAAIAAGVPKRKSAFEYGGMGRRTSKTDYSGWNGSAYTTTNVTEFIYEGWNLIAEVSTLNDLEPSTNLYVWGLDLSQSLQGAGGIGGLLCVIRNGERYFPVFDGNGNISDYLDQTGAVVAHYEYSPFGRLVVATGAMKDVFSFRFSTKYYEPFWKLYYYGLRYYSPEISRWLNRDPIQEEGGLNLYSFVRNAPSILLDPLGEVDIVGWFVSDQRATAQALLDSYEAKFCNTDIWFSSKLNQTVNFRFQRALALPARFAESAPTRPGQYNPGNRVLTWRPGLVDNLTHELVHPYVAAYHHEISPLRDEAMAYLWQFSLYPALNWFHSLETQGFARPTCAEQQELTMYYWQYAWRDADYRGKTAEVYRRFRPNLVGPILGRDVVNFREIFLLDLNCPRIAARYNDMALRQGCCFQFSCDAGPSSRSIARPENPLPEEYQ
jgi:RHS repeat-associated protein